MSDPRAVPAALPDAHAVEVQLALFGGIWAFVVFTDRAVRGTANDAWSVVIVLACAWVLIRPGSMARLLLLAAIQLAWYVHGYATEAFVHWHIAATTHVALLLIPALHLLRHRRLPTLPEVYAGFAPVARALFFVAIFAAGFAKLNTGFLDPRLSCGAAFYGIQHTVFPYSLLPDTAWMRSFAIYFTLAAEMGAPLLIAARRTRALGFLLTFGFLFVIGTNPVGFLYEFAGLFIAWSLFFAPPEAIATGMEDLGRRLAPITRPLRSTWTRLGAGRWFLGTLLVGGLGVVVFGKGPLDHQSERLTLCRVVFVVGMFVLGAVLVLGGRSVGISRRALPILPRPAVLVLVPLLFLAGEVTPYLGLKHRPTMTMAANSALSTLYSDHLLVNPIPRWSFNRVVTVESASPERLHRGDQMAWITFVDFLAAHPKMKVRFEVDGVTETVERAGDDPRFRHGSILPELLRLKPEHFHRRAPDCGHEAPAHTKR